MSSPQPTDAFTSQINDKDVKRKSVDSSTSHQQQRKSKVRKPERGQTNHPWLYRYAIPNLTELDMATVPHQMYNHHPVSVRGVDTADERYPKMHQLEDTLSIMARKGYRYTWGVARKSLPNLKYTAIDLPPYTPRMSYEERSEQTFLSKDGLTVASNEGFRSARSNVMVREGDWYYEAKILRGNEQGNKDAHVRVGFVRREAELEAPVGGDGYGYGFRDVNGEKVHLSRPKPFMNEPFQTGDVIGLRINIPRAADFKSVPVFRDRFPLKKRNLYFEAIDYVGTKEMNTLMTPMSQRKKDEKVFEPQTIPNSWIRVYKNGKDMGVAFEDLYEFFPPSSDVLKRWEGRLGDDGMLGYYPAISTFKGGMVQVNFGPDFDYPIQGSRAISERYDEMIAEDVVQDVIDEVDFELQTVDGSSGALPQQRHQTKAVSRNGGQGQGQGGSSPSQPPPEPSRQGSPEDEPYSVQSAPFIPVNHPGGVDLTASTAAYNSEMVQPLALDHRMSLQGPQSGSVLHLASSTDESCGNLPIALELPQSAVFANAKAMSQPNSQPSSPVLEHLSHKPPYKVQGGAVEVDVPSQG